MFCKIIDLFFSPSWRMRTQCDCNEFNPPDIYACKTLWILKILRNFGNLVVHIDLRSINFRKWYPIFIENYIAEYCSKTLIKLSFGTMPNLLFKSISVPFTNLEIISLVADSRDLPLIQNFPNLQGISLHSIRTIAPLELNEHKAFDLKYLKVVVSDLYSRSQSDSHLQENYILELLRSHPNLINFKLHYTDIIFHTNIIFLQFAHDNLLKLETLHLIIPEFPNNNETFHFENVVDFTIRTDFKNLKHIPFTFGKLKRFSFRLKHSRFEPCILDFISKNKHLKILYVSTFAGFDYFDHELLSKTNIEELTIETQAIYWLNSEKFIEFLRENQSLRKLILKLRRGESKFLNDEIKAKIIKKTKLTFHEFITLVPGSNSKSKYGCAC